MAGIGSSTGSRTQGANVHLANPSGLNWGHARVKNDERDAIDLIDMLRLGRLPEAWIAPPATRELRELVRYRAKLVALRSGLKAQVHAVMAKEGVLPDATDMFGPAGNAQLDALDLGRRVRAAGRVVRDLIDGLRPRGRDARAGDPSPVARRPGLSGDPARSTGSVRPWPRSSSPRSAT